MKCGSLGFRVWCFDLRGNDMCVVAEEIVNVIVDCGAVPALVMHLQAPLALREDTDPRPYEHEVEKGSAFTLGLLAIKVNRETQGYWSY